MSSLACANGTLLDRFFHYARTTPERTLYTFLRDGEAPETITYRTLRRRVMCLARRVREFAEPGDRALLLCPLGSDFIAAFLACLAAGVIAVPAQMPRRNRPSERLRQIVDDAAPSLVLTSALAMRSFGNVPELQSTGDRVVLSVEDLGNTRAMRGTRPDRPRRGALASRELPWGLPGPDDMAFLQYTSGSTDRPRGVMVTHRNIIANEAAIRAAFGHTRRSVGCLWLPLFHDMGLIGGALQPLFAGFHTVLLSPESFVKQPVEWLRAIGRYQATTAGAPNFAFDYCVARITEEQKRTLDLRSVKVLFNGAEPVQAETLSRFVRAFGPCGLRPEAVYPCYGLAESTLLVSGGPRKEPPRSLWLDAECLESRVVRPVQADHPGSRCLISSGRPTAGARLAIVDPVSRAVLSNGRIGEIWVNSPSVCLGYWNKPAETREAFHAIPNSGNGVASFLRTGDLGFVHSGCLFVVGRIKDVIIIRGRNIYPHDVEALVDRVFDHLGRNASAVFGVSVQGEERLALVVEATRSLATRLRRTPRGNADALGDVPAEVQQLVTRLQCEVAEEFAVTIDRITLVRPGALPRTSSGKVRRQACRDLMALGSLSAILQWKAGEFYSPETPRIVGGCDRHGVVRHGNGEAAASRCRHGVPGGGLSSARESGETATPSLDLRELIVRVVIDYFERHRGLDPRPIGFHTSLLSLGVDSLGATAIALEIERATGQKVSPDLVFEHQTAEELAGYLARRGRNSAFALEKAGKGAILPSPAARFLEDLRERNRPVEALKKLDRYFFETPIARLTASTCEVNNRQMLMFSSFSYLGLIGHPEVNQAAIDAIKAFGGGAHGARLIAGTTSLHQAVEAELARFMQSEAALVFGTGYVANLATIQALVGKHDYVVGDAWNHASIADGCAFSGAEFAVYGHNDMGDLLRCLKGARGRFTLVVVDAVHSMEGDIAPLPEIVRLCRRHDALLMVDEAHSLGVLGTTGGGIQEYYGLSPEAIDVKMGTLSKGLASQGGFVAGREEIITHLKYNARGFVFSTAPPAPSMAAAMKALEILQREPQRVEALRRNAARLLNGLHAAGLKTTRTQTPIVPVLCESMEKTLAMTATCRQRGLFVVPVFYPVVPRNSPRIRLNVTAAHSEEQIDEAVEILACAGRDAGLIS
jgi:8-amino-7-oxononanoate synthase